VYIQACLNPFYYQILHYRETKNVTDDGWDKRLGPGMPHFTRRNDK